MKRKFKSKLEEKVAWEEWQLSQKRRLVDKILFCPVEYWLGSHFSSGFEIKEEVESLKQKYGNE